MNKLFCAAFLVASCAFASSAVYTVDCGTKEIIVTNTMALGEYADLEIMRIGNADATDLIVSLWDKRGNIMACSSNFYPSCTGSARGTLSLATTNLLRQFIGLPVSAERSFVLSIWDNDNHLLLGQADVPVMNSAIADTSHFIAVSNDFWHGIDLSNYATKVWVGSELVPYATTNFVNERTRPFASTNWVVDYVSTNTSPLPTNIATQPWVIDYVSTNSGAAPTNVATQPWVVDYVSTNTIPAIVDTNAIVSAAVEAGATNFYGLGATTFGEASTNHLDFGHQAYSVGVGIGAEKVYVGMYADESEVYATKLVLNNEPLEAWNELAPPEDTCDVAPFVIPWVRYSTHIFSTSNFWAQQLEVGVAGGSIAFDKANPAPLSVMWARMNLHGNGATIQTNNLVGFDANKVPSSGWFWMQLESYPSSTNFAVVDIRVED